MRLKEIAVPAVFMVTLFGVILISPQLGTFLAILSPVPLVIVYLQQGKETGIIGVSVVVFVLLVVIGRNQAIFFAAEYGVLALVMGESIRRNLPLERTILFGAFATAIASGGLLFLIFAGNEVSPTEFLQQQVKGQLLQSLNTLKELDTKNLELKGFDQETANSISQKLAWSYPAFIFSGSLFVALINYSLVSLIWRRVYSDGKYFKDSFSRWVLPEFFVWILLISVFIVWLSKKSFIFGLGLNVLIFSVVVYCLQGISIAVFFLENKSVPLFLWLILFVFIFTQPFLIGILIGMGIFDLWIDFRKLKIKPVLPSSNEEE